MLYMMRHGKTEWNKKYKLQGQTDVRLAEDGIAMAEKAARDYADVHFDICFSSPLSRARRTAEILLENRNVPIVTDERLLEMCFGDCEGVENCLETEGCLAGELFRAPENYTKLPEGAESLDELFARVGDFLDNVALPLVREGKDVLIVGHGVMNSCIYSIINDLPREKFWSADCENCKLVKLLQ